MALNKKVVNTAAEAIIAHRRELVARARLRGATQREIVEGLALANCLNPDTNEPWSLGTINSDLKALQAEWRRESKKAVDHHKARQLAELNEAKRQAWHDNDLQSVLRAIGQEMDLLGTEAPKVTEVTGKGGEPLNHRVNHAIDGDTATNIFDILAGAGALHAVADGTKDDGVHPA